MKICLLGSQGTGKTTLVNLFKGKVPVVDNVARKVIAVGGACNESGTAESQKQIFVDYLEALSQENFLSTRSVIDVLAYTTYLASNCTVDWLDNDSQERYKKLLNELWSERRKVKSWLEKNPEVVICYVPVEFEIEGDGVRSVNKDYQKKIDLIMKCLFDRYIKEGLIKYGYIIKGTIEERQKQLEEIIKKY